MNIVDEEVTLVLPEHCLALVRTLLRQHAPNHEFFVFGSRALQSETDRQRVKTHSDLDLAYAGAPLPLVTSYHPLEAFSESDLPMRVDIVAADDLPQDWGVRGWVV
jgi:predicted nucleotidyltransferase